MRAAMAGMIVAVFYVVNYAIVGVFDGLHLGGTSMAGVGKTLAATGFSRGSFNFAFRISNLSR